MLRGVVVEGAGDRRARGMAPGRVRLAAVRVGAGASAWMTAGVGVARAETAGLPGQDR